MAHIKLLSIKYAATLILLYLVLGIAYGISISQIIFVSLISLLIYYVGDIIILGRTNNFIATMFDLVANFVLIFSMLGLIKFGGDQLIAAFISTIVLSFYEIFFHFYVVDELNLRQDNIFTSSYDYLTEFSSEFDPIFDDIDDFF
ncbi:YndM family protein [Amphibacillus xylanus]|uniref:DUF2512 family protein n=1 Tax=Amphibacillus xylanus (strain ATCC 51415 / DSM 6626 / JCM 7361 / LMG 17667 / NBRC 15112 / Ep01) TaxID=698758 RepID=K0J2T8_AMPXN|nr:YndM family protein [Amphibacillus xylanus]BAM47452.1 hypothetical protein AXY_13200 [Amphibacillus xylanus NBRC 15112]